MNLVFESWILSYPQLQSSPNIVCLKGGCEGPREIGEGNRRGPMASWIFQRYVSKEEHRDEVQNSEEKLNRERLSIEKANSVKGQNQSKPKLQTQDRYCCKTLMGKRRKQN